MGCFPTREKGIHTYVPRFAIYTFELGAIANLSATSVPEVQQSGTAQAEVQAQGMAYPLAVIRITVPQSLLPPNGFNSAGPNGEKSPAEVLNDELKNWQGMRTSEGSQSVRSSHLFCKLASHVLKARLIVFSILCYTLNQSSFVKCMQA